MEMTLEDEMQALEDEAFLATVETSPARGFGYRAFVSRSKGRSKGRGRKRRDVPYQRHHWQEFELISLNKTTWVSYRDGNGKLDRWCPAGITEDDLIVELRRIYA